jgi:hypothetical protein
MLNETRRANKATRNAGDSVAKMSRTKVLFVTLDFRLCKRYSDCRKIWIERSDLKAAKVVFLKAVHEIKQSSSDILRIIINCFHPRPSLTNCLTKIHLNVTLLPPSGYFKRTFSKKFLHKNSVRISSLPETILVYSYFRLTYEYFSSHFVFKYL